MTILRPIGIFALLIAVALPEASHAQSRSSSAIAAVVNDDAISQYDVEKRLRFIVTTTKISAAPDMLARVRPQVLNTLINEKLQMQDAKKNSIEVTDKEVADAIANIERERGMQPGAITAMLDSSFVPRETFTDQLRAQIAWNKLMGKNVRPRVRLSDEEIALAQKNYTAPIVVQELQIGIFMMPIDSKAKEPQVRKFAEKIASETRRGANFEELTRQFSGGKIDKFWVRPESLDPMVAKSLATAREGSVVGPLRNTEGYTLIKVYAVRAKDDGTKTSDPNVKLKEIFFKMKPDAGAREAQSLVTISQEVAKNPGTCEDKNIPEVDLRDMETEVNFISGALSTLTPAVRAMAATMRVGSMSEPLAAKDGVHVYMLCERETKTETISREEIYPMLMQKKMELEAQKYLRNLRRNAFIDVRMK